MPSRTSFKPVDIQVIYGGCEHVLTKTQVIPLQVPVDETPKSEKRISNSSQLSRSSRRNSWKSFFCSGAEQVEHESDNEADIDDLDFWCKGLQLVDNVPGLCPNCNVRQSRLVTQQQERDAEIIRAQVAQEKDEERTRQRQSFRRMEERRTKFRCSKCIQEGRKIIDRSANEGFCCEFGRSFWDASSESLLFPDQQHGSSRKSNPASFEVPTAGLKRMTIGTATARQAATQAASSYGWQSKPDEWNRIQPELVSQFVSIPGNDPASLPGPAIPRYEDANIDIERWNNQVQTNHGTYPRARASAPTKPLPPLPLGALTRQSRAAPLRLQQSTRQHESRKEAPAARRDSEVSEMSTPRDMGDASPVSPTNSRWPSITERPKAREGEHGLERQISKLGHEIDDALECWQQPNERRHRR
ncbi:hypothetical protein EYC80_007959 [Monilinia laxa]|uniref:Uncharacterized protein n=1 Tax=Monilinia laxa TaxID=61186 RepID=A0A5N6JUE9_MONLA|nr:hypothetical protein EYC80_007959 [Monilinia laxa]